MTDAVQGGATSRRRRASRAAVPAVVAVAGAVALAGCQTTQDKSAALKAKAVAADKPRRLELGRPSSDVRVRSRQQLSGPDGSALVVELENRSSRALLRVPVSVRISQGGQEQFANDIEGGDELLLRVPVLPPRGRVTWVNANLPLVARGADLRVALGAPTRRSKRPAEPLPVTGLKRDPDAVAGEPITVRGTVRNPLRRAQTEVPVYVTVREGGRVVAAGASRVAEIAPGSRASFEAVLIGDGRRGRLAARALPTKLPTSQRSTR